VHLFLSDPGCTTFLVDELQRTASPESLRQIEGLGAAASTELEGRLLAFATQTLPDASEVSAASINAWADQIIDAVVGVFSDHQAWRLHLWPQYGEGKAGQHRCELIRRSLCERLKKRRRHLLRSLIDSEAVFDAQTSLVQCVLTSPETGWLSVAPAPLPYSLRGLISSFPSGMVPLADDKSAPSRAFTKLVEAEQRLGRRIEHGQTCVDLGASPGSWSYVALQRGAQVIAVDRSELRADLMRHPHLRFEMADAFKFKPSQLVDWLVCDVIAAPQRSMDLLLEWLRERRMRHFIVTIKFKGHDEYALLEEIKQKAPPLCAEFHLKHLTANKNEVCAFGVV